MSHSILIIDGDSDDRKIIESFLKNAGSANILLSGDGKAGVDLAKQHKPDIVVMDTNLPGVNGFDACARIKEFLGDETRVIIMTRHVDAVDAVKARKHGADDYCVKTSDCADLIESVRFFLGSGD